MPLCSYLVIPKAGRGAPVAAGLASLPGCTVQPAHNRELIILLTETDDADEESRLRRMLEEIDGVEAIVLTFGELDVSEAPEAIAPRT